MARLAQVLAILGATLLLGPLPAAFGAPTNIYTVAGGGGTLVPAGGSIAATSAQLFAPVSVSPVGDSGFRTLDGKCAPLEVFDDAGKDTGNIVYLGGAPGTCTTGAAPSSNPFGLGPLATNLTFANPCCIRPWGGWMLANNPASYGARVEWENGTGRVHTAAGSTAPTGCNTATPEAAPDNVLAVNAKFCRIAGLATAAPTETFMIGETERQQNGNGDVYEIVGDIFPDNNLTVHHLSGSRPVAGVAYSHGGGRLVADGKKLVYSVANDGSTAVIAGSFNAPAGFGGDGGGADGAKLNKPVALAMTWDEGYLIADQDNCRIRKVGSADNLSHISTVAGGDCQPSPPSELGDGGPSTSAYLGHPTDIAMITSGILVADKDDNRIRLVDRTSIISAPKDGAFSADATPEFTFASLDTPPRFKCTLDNGTAFDCPSPFTLPTTTDGNHTLRVWENGHGIEPENMLFFTSPPDPTPAVAKFMVDATPPDPFGLLEPAANAGVPNGSPTFAWSPAIDEGAGVAHYELWIDGVKNRDVALDACSDDRCSVQPDGLIPEGSRHWQILAVDDVANTRSSEDRNVNVGSDPIAAFTASPNPALVGRAVAFDASTSSDQSGIAHYEWDLDGDGAFEVDGGTSATTARTYTAPATVPVKLRVTDGTGRTAMASASLKISDPNTAQALLGISVNSGAQYTRTPNVKLLVKPPALASSILVSNDGGFLAPSTFPIATSIEWKLDSSGPERLPKTVYARFMLGPIISETYTDDIILDEIPPVVQQAALVPLPPPGRAASAARLTTFKLKVKAKDSNSGVAKLQVTANKRKPGKLLPYKTKVSVKSAAKPRLLRAQDRAGNFSAWRKLR